MHVKCKSQAETFYENIGFKQLKELYKYMHYSQISPIWYALLLNNE